MYVAAGPSIHAHFTDRWAAVWCLVANTHQDLQIDLSHVEGSQVISSGAAKSIAPFFLGHEVVSITRRLSSFLMTSSAAECIRHGDGDVADAVETPFREDPTQA